MLNTTIGQFLLVILTSFLLLIVLPGKKGLAGEAGQELPPRIFIVGDSTACNYPPSQAPRAGWGQVRPSFRRRSGSGQCRCFRPQPKSFLRKSALIKCCRD